MAGFFETTGRANDVSGAASANGEGAREKVRDAVRGVLITLEQAEKRGISPDKCKEGQEAVKIVKTAVDKAPTPDIAPNPQDNPNPAPTEPTTPRLGLGR